MTTSELRIGSYYRFSEDFEDTSLGRCGHGERELELQDLYWLMEGTESLKDSIYSIPLTEEWLERLGFEHEGEVTSRLKLDTDFGIVTINLKRPKEGCKYVHELQNLYFALTKKELEITQTACNG